MSLPCPAHVALVPELHVQKPAVLGFGQGLGPSNVRIRCTGVLPSVSTAEAPFGGILCASCVFAPAVHDIACKVELVKDMNKSLGAV